jgi:hypothetical protein
VIEHDFYGLDGERITVGVTAGGAVEISVCPADLIDEEEIRDGDGNFGAWMRGRDAFRLAEFIVETLAFRDRTRDEAPTT